MAYGLNSQPFVGPEAPVQAAVALTGNAVAGLNDWRSLSEDGRLALVDEALSYPANDDLIDGLPVAL